MKFKNLSKLSILILSSLLLPYAIAAPDCPSLERASDSGTSGYMFAVDESDLKHLNADELRLVRNEIYARHGYLFKDDKLRAYFGAKAWYSGDTIDSTHVYCNFNDVTRKTVDLIHDLEKQVKPNAKKGIKCQTFSYFGDPAGAVFHKFPVSREDLVGLNAKELRLLRNEYYAKHGLFFEDSQLRQYFEQQGDYHPTTSDSRKLYCEHFNQAERDSVELILSFEKRLKK